MLTKQSIDEELHKDIGRLTGFYSMSEILEQYKQIGINLTEDEFKRIKYT